MSSRSASSKVLDRLLTTGLHISKEKATINDAMFRHSIMCQAFLPYRRPKDDTHWRHNDGTTTIFVTSGVDTNPRTGKTEFVGVPYGAKARLILAYLDSEAIRTGQRIIDVEHSMTAFIKRLGFNADGYTIRSMKEQLVRIRECSIKMERDEKNMEKDVVERHRVRFNFVNADKSEIANRDGLKIVDGIDAWYPKDENQRVLWNSTIELNQDYFNSLIDRAVPLDTRALGALSHSAMALDIYSFLAQRLCNVKPHSPTFLTWRDAKLQFGQGYNDMYKFKQVFRKCLAQVKLTYQAASMSFIEDPNRGFRMKYAEPPIPKKHQVFVSQRTGNVGKTLKQALPNRAKQAKLL